MALSKPSFLTHLKTLAKPPHRHLRRPSFLSLRSLSFATPEDAAADRRRRKRRLRIEPPISPLHRSQQQQQPPKPQNPNPNPNSPKLPEPVSALSGNRLNLHNKILALIRRNDLEEAALYTRHSIYSNCRPTIYTVNSVLAAQLRQSKYSDLLSLHRFITQAGVAPNIVTHNLIFQTYLDCRKPDTAMEHYKQLINDAPFNPSPTTYRILIKGLVDNGKLERAMELKEEMVDVKGFEPDPVVYHYLMVGCVRNSDSDGVFRLYEELKEKLGGEVEDGVVIGSLMKGYFIKEMEKEAMECYEQASKVKMNAVAYNSVLEALCGYGKFDEALKLFDRMREEHFPPRRFTVNLGSFNVMADGYCAQGRFKEAVEVFRKMGEYRCDPDTLSFNNLIQHLCSNGMLSEAEEVYGEMGEKGVNPDEYTYSLLMDTCFEENRPDDAAEYFRKMVDEKLRPNLAVYSRLADGLVKVGKVDEAKSFFDLMGKKLKMDVASYQFIMKALSDAGKFDEVLNVVDTLLEDEWIELNEELQEFIKGELRKDGREDELGKLIEEKERLKAEAKAKEIEEAEAAKRSRSAAVSSLLPSSLFGKKETGSTEATEKVGEAASASVEAAPAADTNSAEQAVIGESSDEESKSEGANEQVVA
ncbi:putative tetratricopeptide-like helical domain-containing protein [Rosa chinensis]|uniref:Putative tetratricopeptide-like helical domain-containing protein n=1 Tax=Rosa chinensis TaxID=74649 RepID=A0A2P6SP01_ROSCH|nr:pentatricopeptide repeat-containing protein At3g49240, mitochondrial [Rosa chinensis]PRQ60389.1 putative tetratricopeptide-like helical domain-containing protein [Rosa chinensis]